MKMRDCEMVGDLKVPNMHWGLAGEEDREQACRGPQGTAGPHWGRGLNG